jgi:hypothetical protein
MSRVDERIRREIERLSVPVDGRGAFDRVAGRRRRLRTAHRARRAALAVAVVAGTAAGWVGLVRVFDAGDRTRVGSGADLPTSSPSEGLPIVSAFCGSRGILVDLDGDGGQDDLLETWGETSKTDVSCEELPVLQRFVVHLEIDAEANVGPSFTQELPECPDPYACRVIATPEIDGDGRPEIAVQLGAGASTIYFALYRFDPAAPTGPLERLEIAEPGDPWHEEFGFSPGPATFSWFGSVTHQHWLSCDEDPQRRLAAITVLRAYDDPDDPHIEEVHGVLFRLEGTTLVVDFTWDEQVPEATLEMPLHLCGSPLLLD